MATTASASPGDDAPTPASAAEALHAALDELHRAEDRAWQTYAAELEAATRRFDATLAQVSAQASVHLPADTSAGHQLADTLAAVRGDAEHTLRTARERVQHTIDEVGRAVQDFGRGLRTP